MPKKVGAWSESKGWSAERKFRKGRSAERQSQKGSERESLFTPAPLQPGSSLAYFCTGDIPTGFFHQGGTYLADHYEHLILSEELPIRNLYN